MPALDRAWHFSGWRLAALVAALTLYVGLTVHSQVSHLTDKPLPDFLMEDYGYYARGYARWLAGESPYADRVIGTAFIYPPQALLVVAFFESLGPLPIKYAVYATLALAALVGSVLLVLRRLDVSPSDPRGDQRGWIALVLALGFAPFGWCLYLGQVNPFVAFTAAAGFFLAERKPWAAGAAIAVGVAIKLTPLVMLVLLLRRRYLRVHIAFAVASVVLFLVAGAVFGFQHYLDYLAVARELKDSFPLGLNGSLSLVNSLYLIAGAVGLPTEGWQGAVQLLYTVVVGSMLLLGTWLTRDGLHRHLFYALVALGMTLMPNVLWYHHLVFLLPALLTLVLSTQSSVLLRVGACVALGVIQLDRLLYPKLDKLTTTPVCIVLLLLVFVEMVRLSPGLLPDVRSRRWLAERSRALGRPSAPRL
ncbi:MAG: hypothetical protein RLZZ450_959 [Pseudomonadota bacterium]